MKNLRKIATVALAGCMAATTILSGCAKKDDTKSAGTKKEEKTTNLVWYTIGGEPKDLEKVVTEMNKYTKEKINTTVDMKFVDWGDYTQKLSVIINSGENYDIAFTCSWANEYMPNVRKGAFLELNDLLDNEGKDLKAAVNPNFWKGISVDGKIYAVPTNKELPWSRVWTFTKSLVDKYKIDTTKLDTLESLEPALATIKKNEPDIIPLPLRSEGSAAITQQFDQPIGGVPVGIYLNDSSAKVVNVYEMDDVKKSLNTLRDYYVKGYINKDAATNTQDLKNRFVAQGDYQPYAEYVWAKDLGYDVVTNRRMDDYVETSSTTGSMQAISANSQNPKKAMEFLNLLNTDSYLRNLVNYGIEGTHYKKTSDTSITMLPDSKNYAVPYFSLGNQLITYTVDPEPKDKWSKFEEFNNNAKVSPILGFFFDNSNVQTEIANIQNVTTQYNATLLTGSLDNPDKVLQEMNSKLEKAGINKVKEELQKQIDAWKAKQ